MKFLHIDYNRNNYIDDERNDTVGNTMLLRICKRTFSDYNLKKCLKTCCTENDVSIFKIKHFLLITILNSNIVFASLSLRSKRSSEMAAEEENDVIEEMK